MIKKGFTLLSVLITLMIVSSLTLLVLKNYEEIDDDYLYFMNEYLNCQIDALTNRQENHLDNYDVYFNNMGHVNQARTIEIGRHKVVIHLGNGYLTYE